MSKAAKKLSSEEIFAQPVPNILQLTAGINEIVAGGEVNSYGVRNAILLEKKKELIRQQNDNVLPASAKALQAQAQRNIQAQQTTRMNLYRKGATVNKATPEMLRAEAENSEIDHSRKLGRNFQVANPSFVRPDETDAHHIVSRSHWRADPARQILYKVGIGINDSDNASILPRFKTTIIASFPYAAKHQGIHTHVYHANVFYDLSSQPEKTQIATRLTLRSIDSQLIAGIYPF